MNLTNADVGVSLRIFIDPPGIKSIGFSSRFFTRLWRRVLAGDGEDVGVVDGAGVDGVGGGEARGGVDAGIFVGEDGDAGAGAAGDEATDVGGGGLGDSATDLGSGGVVGRGSEIFDLDVESAQVSDEGVFERSAEVIGGGDDFYGAGGFCCHG